MEKKGPEFSLCICFEDSLAVTEEGKNFLEPHRLLETEYGFILLIKRWNSTDWVALHWQETHMRFVFFLRQFQEGCVECWCWMSIFQAPRERGRAFNLDWLNPSGPQIFYK